VYEISRRTAERICAIFTGKTCFVPRSEEFECQGQTVVAQNGFGIHVLLHNVPCYLKWTSESDDLGKGERRSDT